jgi:putative transposase
LYFLRLYQKYICPIARTYAYALLPDHFHFLITIRSIEELPDPIATCPRKLSLAFGNLQNAYAKAFNSRYKRVSSLFEDRFERVPVNSEERYTYLIFYLHFNPQKHKIVKDYSQYNYTSYSTLLTDADTFLEREQVMEWFGGRENFIEAHDSFGKGFSN